jgi:dTMP kinase
MNITTAVANLFVSFEGGEGSGKSTHLELAAAFLGTLGYPVTTTRDPGGTAIGTGIRSLLLDAQNTALAPLTELLLYEASRAQLTEETIRPALAAGHVVLCDRFVHSTTAYQGYGRGLDRELIAKLNQAATRGLMPDLTLWFDIGPATGLLRARARQGVNALDRLEREALAFHERVRDGYQALAAAEPGRILRIDASPSIATIQGTVREVLLRRLAQQVVVPEELEVYHRLRGLVSPRIGRPLERVT